MDEVKSKKDVILEARKEKRKDTFFYNDGHLSSQEYAELEPKHQKYTGTSRVPRRHGKIWLWCIRGIHRTRKVSLANDCCKKRWILRDYQDALDKPPTQYPLTPRSKWKMHYIYQNFTSECPDVWIRLPRHKWPKSWSGIEDQVVPLERKLYGQPTCRLLVGKTI